MVHSYSARLEINGIMSTGNQVLQNSKNKVPKWVWLAIAFLALVAVVLVYLLYVQKNKAITVTQPEEEAVNEELKPALETFKDPYTGVVLDYDPEKVRVVANDYSGQENSFTQQAFDPNKVTVFINMLDAKRTVFSPDQNNIADWVEKANSGELKDLSYVNKNGITLYRENKINDWSYERTGFTAVRENMLITITTNTLRRASGENPSTLSSVEYYDIFKETVDTLRFAKASDFTTAQKDLAKVFHYCIYTNKYQNGDDIGEKDSQCIAMKRLYDSSDIDDRRSSEACDGVKDEDVTGDGAKDKVISFSACGSGSSYPAVYSAHNGFINHYVLEYPEGRYPNVRTEKSYPDTGLSQFAVFDGKVVVAVPVHSEQDDCHTCVTGGVEFIQYSFKGNGFEIANYKYDPNYKWDYEELTQNPF